MPYKPVNLQESRKPFHIYEKQAAWFFHSDGLTAPVAKAVMLAAAFAADTALFMLFLVKQTVFWGFEPAFADKFGGYSKQ